VEDSGEVSAIGLSPAAREGHAVLSGIVRRDAADEVLRFLSSRGVPERDIALLETEDVGPIRPGREPTGTLIWADMIGQARANARPVARYIAFMAVAGIIAGYGVITVNQTLIVGAMAVSPDTLPVTAACVGLVDRHIRLVLKALGTFAIGLGTTGLAALVLPPPLKLQGRLPFGFPESSALTGLVTIGVGTIGVALAAGVAAMLALETRASSAVGVAISVTTIPAAAYFGVAAATEDLARAWGAWPCSGSTWPCCWSAGRSRCWCSAGCAGNQHDARGRRAPACSPRDLLALPQATHVGHHGPEHLVVPGSPLGVPQDRQQPDYPQWKQGQSEPGPQGGLEQGRILVAVVPADRDAHQHLPHGLPGQPPEQREVKERQHRRGQTERRGQPMRRRQVCDRLPDDLGQHPDGARRGGDDNQVHA
jgi:uncharacterized hydrophobic protein (TIGR00271 family)